MNRNASSRSSSSHVAVPSDLASIAEILAFANSKWVLCAPWFLFVSGDFSFGIFTGDVRFLHDYPPIRPFNQNFPLFA